MAVNPEAALVFLGNGQKDEPFTTSDIIAEHTGVEHESIVRTIKRQEERLERFGIFRLEIGKLQKGAGRSHKTYRLNEEQATLLITFLKNTDVVADFKVELVRQFYEMRRLLLERQSAQWQQVRQNNKNIRRLETDAIQAFVAYATANGSGHAGMYYRHFTELANRAAGIVPGTVRDQLPTAVLINLQLVEQVIDRAIRAELTAKTEYHEAFQQIKAKVEKVAVLAFTPPPSAPALSAGQPPPSVE